MTREWWWHPDCDSRRKTRSRSLIYLRDGLCLGFLLLLSGFPPLFERGEAAEAARASDNSAPFTVYSAAPSASPSDLFGPIQISPSVVPHNLHPNVPSPPMYPYFPRTPEPILTGRCPVNISAISQTVEKTASDCSAPLATYLGNVICCPQLYSLLRIVQGEYSVVTGSLVLNKTEANDCFSDIISVLTSSGANNTIPELCSVKAANLTGGSCSVKDVLDFEEAVNTSKLLDACAAVDPLKECCRPVCQTVIADAAVRLASRDSTALSKNAALASSVEQVAVDDCKGVVFAWLSRHLYLDAANSAFRILFSCKVNKVCPLELKDPSSVIKACSGSSPSHTSCCSSLNNYILTVQKQMLITNKQALNCATLFGSMLEKRGVVTNVYELCDVDLKDFSLQAYDGQQGCLLRSLPTDVVFDNSTGISFTCDLSDNIAAPWPSSSSLSSLSTCAPVSLPALPTSETSDHVGAGGIGADIYLVTGLGMLVGYQLSRSAMQDYLLFLITLQLNYCCYLEFDIQEEFPMTSLREINVLLSFHHPSVVDVKEVVVGSNLDSIFMVMEYMEHDLKALLETMKHPFSESEVKCLMLQLLEGVKYLHDNWVLHRDLKTSNLLLNNKGELKICDFGLARQYGSPLKPYTNTVVTLWYRAPELLLGAKQYSTAIDMWSVGCIMAELLAKGPLFNGKSEITQLDKIFRTLGTPNEKIWPNIVTLPGVKFNFSKHPYNNLREKFPLTSFSGKPTLSESGFDLLNRLLTYDPSKRVTAEEALKHTWFSEVPLPKSKDFMPTYPARNDHDRRKMRLLKSPDPLEEQRIRELQQGDLGTASLFG